MLRYEDFVSLVQRNKVMLFAENRYGIPSLEESTPDNPWFSGLEEDPWVWKNRIAQEGKALYGHFFAGKLAFCAPDFLPVLLYTIAPENDLEYRFETGEVDALQMRIVKELQNEDGQRKDQLRKTVGETQKSRFERALTLLEQALIVCISGQSRRINKQGQPYGWQVNEFSLVETRFPQSFTAASALGSVRARAELEAFLQKQHANWPGVYSPFTDREGK